MKRFRAFAAISCLMQGSSFPITFAETPSLVPQYNALSVFAPELDESFGSDAWEVFSSSRQPNSMSMPRRQRRSVPTLPVNAVYELEAQIPVIGRQLFQLKILGEGVASLVIEGMLQLTDVIRYEVDGDGEFAFDLSDTTKAILSRFRTRLVKVRYCSESDTPSVIVRPPLPTNIKLTLKRKALPIPA